MGKGIHADSFIPGLTSSAPSIPCSRLLRRALQSLVVFLLILSIGGPWVILQSVAWVSMAAGYSKEGSLSQALLKTFDGQHPCQLCRYVDNGRKTDQQREVQLPALKIDFFLQSQPVVLDIPQFSLPQLGFSLLLAARAEPPPTPPPLVLS